MHQMKGGVQINLGQTIWCLTSILTMQGPASSSQSIVHWLWFVVVHELYKLGAAAVGRTDDNDVGKVWRPRWLHAMGQGRKARC